MLSKKVICTCGHDAHMNSCLDCLCNLYLPAGHTPELENFLCPRCSKVRMERNALGYVCIVCFYFMTSQQVMEYTG